MEMSSFPACVSVFCLLHVKYKLWVAFTVCAKLLSIYTVKQCPVSFEAFGWIRRDSLALNTSEFIMMLLLIVIDSFLAIFLVQIDLCLICPQDVVPGLFLLTYFSGEVHCRSLLTLTQSSLFPRGCS